MKSVLNIWMQPFYSRWNLGKSRSLLIFLLAIPVLVQAIVLIGGQRNGKEFSLGLHLLTLGISVVAVFVLVFFWWFVSLLMQISMQYSPQNARLVPHLKRNLYIAIVVPILFISLAVSIAFSIANRRVDMVPFLATATFSSLFTLSIRGPWMVLPFVLSFQVPAYFERNRGENPLFLIQNYTGVSMQVQCFILGLAFVLLATAWLLSVRGEAHFAMHKRAKLYGSGTKTTMELDDLGSTNFASLYFRKMQRDLASANGLASEFDRKTLVNYVFGPGTHWSTMVIQVITLSLGVCLFFVVLSLLSSTKSDFFKGFGYGFVWGFALLFLVSQPVLYLVQIFMALNKTKQEQGLLCLAPNAGTRVEIDRQLSVYMLRQFISRFGVSACASALFVYLSGVFDAKAAALLLYLASISICLIALAHDFGKMRSGNDHSLLKWGIIAICCFVLMGASLFVLPYEAVYIYIIIALSFAALSYRARERRYRTAVRFPVGCNV